MRFSSSFQGGRGERLSAEDVGGGKEREEEIFFSVVNCYLPSALIFFKHFFVRESHEFSSSYLLSESFSLETIGSGEQCQVVSPPTAFLFFFGGGRGKKEGTDSKLFFLKNSHFLHDSKDASYVLRERAGHPCLHIGGEKRDGEGGGVECFFFCFLPPFQNPQNPEFSSLVVVNLQKVAPDGKATHSAHPARFSPDDKFSRERVTLKKRFGLLPTQKEEVVF